MRFKVLTALITKMAVFGIWRRVVGYKSTEVSDYSVLSIIGIYDDDGSSRISWNVGTSQKTTNFTNTQGVILWTPDCSSLAAF
jgi:hypothetical protein